MGNRCPDCNKFVSLEMGDIEVTQDPEVEDMENGKGLLRLTIKISKNCAECGTEISNKEVEVETEIDLSGFEESN